MVVLIDAATELAKLQALEGLTPQTAFAAGVGFAPLASYRDSTIFAIKASGKTAWERHPDGDELVRILAGTATFEIVTDAGPPQSFEAGAGMIAIVPKGVWHRAHFSPGMILLSVTPTHTEFVKRDVDDPRTA